MNHRIIVPFFCGPILFPRWIITNDITLIKGHRRLKIVDKADIFVNIHVNLENCKDFLNFSQINNLSELRRILIVFAADSRSKKKRKTFRSQPVNGWKRGEEGDGNTRQAFFRSCEFTMESVTRDGKRTTRRRISGPRKVAEIKFPAVERHSSPRSGRGRVARARVVHRAARSMERL